MQELSHNFRLTDFQAALGISQLKRANEGLARRKQIAEKYRQKFSEISEVTIRELPDNSIHAYHLFIIETEERKKLYDHLRENGIFSQIHYIPVHLMPYYKQFGWKKGDFPMAEDYYEHCISLPMYPSLGDDDQDYVIEKVAEFFNS